MGMSCFTKTAKFCGFLSKSGEIEDLLKQNQ